MIEFITKKNLAVLYIGLCLTIWILPTYDGVDIIGGQWLNFSLLNFLGLALVLKEYDKKILGALFSNPIIIFFCGFLIWGLLSFTYAGNQPETLIVSSRNLNLFLFLFNTTYLILYHKFNHIYFSYFLTFLLGIEVFLVLTDTYFINGTLIGLNRGMVSKGIAANINITTYSILYKVPFVLYLFYKGTNVKILSFTLLLFAYFTIYILGARSAILASGAIIIVTLFYSFIKTKKLELNLILFLVPILIAFSINYFSNRLSEGTSIVDRVSTLTDFQSDQSASDRLSYYKLSLEYFKENPILGMGLGNWKIESIPYVIDRSNVYIFPYHAHNDFLEVLSELGIIGIILYSSIFLIIIFYLFKLLNKFSQDYFKFGLVFVLFFTIYLIDASFNFPHARPVQQVVLLLVFSIILSKTIKQYNQVNSFKSSLGKWLLTSFFLFLSLSVYSNYRVLVSMQQQLRLLREFNSGEYSSDEVFISSLESTYPSVGVTVLPLKAMVSNYLVSKDSEKGLSLALASIKDNPYVYLGDVLASKIYSKMGLKDSARYYASRAYKNSPTIELSAVNYFPFLTSEKNASEFKKISELLKRSKSEFIWDIYFKSVFSIKDSLSDVDKELLKIGINRFPKFKKLDFLNKTKEFSREELQKAKSLSNEADDYFNKKQYLEAIKLYKEANAIIPSESAYIENIARAYMLSEDFNNSIENFKTLISNYDISSGEPEFYIAAMLFKLDKKSECCQYLNRSIRKGYYPSKKLREQICFN